MTEDNRPAGRTVRWKRPERVTDLDGALDDVAVHGPGDWENDYGPKDWWAVSTGDDSIVAYFANEADAFRFRLDLINYWLNG
jgi:hypothetical protein